MKSTKLQILERTAPVDGVETIIKTKYITGNMASSGTSITVAHGINQAKMLSYKVIINNTTFPYLQGMMWVDDTFDYWYRMDATNIVVNGIPATYLNQRYTIKIEYME